MNTQTVSLRIRLSAMLCAVFLLGMIILYVAAVSYARLAVDKSYDRLLRGSAITIAETITANGDKFNVDVPYSALDMLSSAPNDRVFYRIVGPRGETVTGTTDLPTGPEIRALDLAAAASGQFYEADFRGERFRIISLAREIAQPGETGRIYVLVAQTMRARGVMTRTLVFGSLVPIGLMTLSALVVVWLGIYFALRPLDRLRQEMAQRGMDDFRPLETEVPAEIAPVARAINSYMHRLQTNVAALRSFIADTAHQIRTPIAAIHAQAQVSESGDADEMRRGLVAVQRNSARLTHLVNQMLSDATMQHRAHNEDLADFDLLLVLRESIRDLGPLADDCEISLTSEVEAAPMIGDRVMIGEALRNLIDNGLTHGRDERAEVAIELDRQGPDHVLAIADRGPGIPTELRARVFDRFYRAAGQVPGAGLGLAIVRDAILAHGGTIRLCDRGGVGLLVEIRLPAWEGAA